MRAWLLAVGILVNLLGAPAAHALSVSGPFNFREHVGPNPLGIGIPDRLVFGLVAVEPSGPPTTATATQGATVVPLNFSPSSLFPRLYFTVIPFDPALTGAWSITATRDLETVGPVVTNSIPNPRLLPLVENVRVLGIGLTPTIQWELPDLTGFTVNRIRIRITDADTNDTLAFQVFVPPLITPEGAQKLGTRFTMPPGVLQYGRRYVFRVMLEGLIPGTGFLENRSSAFSGIYAPATVVAGDGFSLYSDRGVFEGQLGPIVLDDYSNPGYRNNPDPILIGFHSDAAMSAVLGETDYVATRFANRNIVIADPLDGDTRYCAGCNGSFQLNFTTTSVGTAAGVFGAGFDADRIIHSAMFTDHPHALVAFGDGSTRLIPLSQGFWGITAGQRIQSIHVGGSQGESSETIYIEIDNLTIGDSRVLGGVTIDIKPGSFPNPINLGSEGSVPVAILGSPAVPATSIDRLSLRLAGAPARAKRNAGLMAAFEDVNGDDILDLVVHFETAALQLDASSTEAVLEGALLDGTPIRGVDSVKIVPKSR